MNKVPIIGILENEIELRTFQAVEDEDTLSIHKAIEMVSYSKASLSLVK